MCVLTSRFANVWSELNKFYMNNFHPFEVVSRYRDPQLQMGENLNYLI